LCFFNQRRASNTCCLFTRNDLGYTLQVSLLPNYLIKTTIVSLRSGNSLHMADISCGNVTQCPFKAKTPLDKCTDGTYLEHLRIRNFSAMLNLFSSGGMSKCGTLLPSLSLTKSPSSETSYQTGCKLFFKKYIGSFLLWHF
jgi:hypothetical protein